MTKETYDALTEKERALIDAVRGLFSKMKTLTVDERLAILDAQVRDTLSLSERVDLNLKWILEEVRALRLDKKTNVG